MPRHYREPFIPLRFSCAVHEAATDEVVIDRSTGRRSTRRVPRWDVRGRADGIAFSKRFERAGLAEAWKRRLDEGYAFGLRFDVRAKQFLPPATRAEVASEQEPTVFEVTEGYYRAHPEWEPKTKVLAAAALNRARRWFLVGGAEPVGQDLAAVEDYLANASFTEDHAIGTLTTAQAAGRAWLVANSVPLADVTKAEVQRFLARFELNQRNGNKVSRTTIIRYTQPLRACWAWALARDDIPVTRNPWRTVKPPRKVKGGPGRADSGASRLAVDTDIVLSVDQALELAERCITAGIWGEVVRCYVLVMALCGLRPSEAVGLVWDDVELPDDDEAGWLVVRRSRRLVASRWLDPEEDPEWGPLKDRDVADSRRVPIHPLLVTGLRRHHDLVGPGPGGLVFHRAGKPFDLSMFGRQVWEPARTEMFPPRPGLAPDDPHQPKLSRLRRHDLRHAACSWWLRSGVDATVCQRWSGHKSLSVFLDVYQSVAPGREAEGVRRLIDSVRVRQLP